MTGRGADRAEQWPDAGYQGLGAERAGQLVAAAGGHREPGQHASLYHLSRRVLCEAEVLAMTLWDEVGGRTWTERAGPRSAITDADARPSHRRRARRVRLAPAGR